MFCLPPTPLVPLASFPCLCSIPGDTSPFGGHQSELPKLSAPRRALPFVLLAGDRAQRNSSFVISFAWEHLVSLKKNHCPTPRGAPRGFLEGAAMLRGAGDDGGATPVSRASGGLPNPPDSKKPAGILCRSLLQLEGSLLLVLLLKKKQNFYPFWVWSPGATLKVWQQGVPGTFSVHVPFLLVIGFLSLIPQVGSTGENFANLKL